MNAIENPILKPEIQQYIQDHLNTDVHTLLLKKSPFPEVSMAEIVQQINGIKTAEKKFPFLLKPNILFPAHLNLEQSSSETTAKYKSALVKGETFLDLTAGFGVDAYFMSKQFKDLVLVEQNKTLLELVKHNWDILDGKAQFIHQNLEDYLANNQRNFDVVYLDPARRDHNKNKVFLLEDLSPNLLDISYKINSISNLLLVKLSPLIDLTYLTSALKNIIEIHIVSVKNDVKEVLVLINNKKKTEDVKIIAVNLDSNDLYFKFNLNDLKDTKSEYSEPLKYLYLPNHAVLKTGAFHLISEQFEIKKLHPNTHLYTSEKLLNQFPGRILEVEKIEAKEIVKNNSYNIISKNHPLKPEEIKKKYQIKDGGKDYLIFTQSIKEKIILKSV